MSHQEWEDIARIRSLAQQIQSLESTIAELRAENLKLNGLFKLLQEDVFDGMECLPECNSHGHADGCPRTEGQAAFHNLRTENERLRKACQDALRWIDDDQYGTAVRNLKNALGGPK